MKVAIIQTNATPNKDENISTVTQHIQTAIANHASLIALPEVWNQKSGTTPSEPEKIPGHSTTPLIDLAKHNDVWILGGSIREYSSSSPRAFNTSVLISPTGEIVARHRKIHLFDVTIGNQSITESDSYQSGLSPTMTNVGPYKAGLSICYDLRFPELYRKYADNYADILFVPSAFTRKTGEAHWEPLLRARAIENQAYVIAPNQHGSGPNGIQLHGHSMIIDPWGTVIAEASANADDIIYATIDANRINSIRDQLPALKHRKLS